MMIEVRDYWNNNTWGPIDFYTSALADVPLSYRTIDPKFTVQKKFTSLFNHNSSLLVQSKVINKCIYLNRNNVRFLSYFSRIFQLYCAANYYGKNCQKFCVSNQDSTYDCSIETGEYICKKGFVGEFCQIRNTK